MSRFKSLIKGRCPKCEKGKVFEKNGSIFLLQAPKMYKNCPHCGHQFEIELGFFWGAMYVSYALTVALAIAIYIVCRFFFSDPFDYKILIIIIFGLSFSWFLTFRYARLIWMYIFTPGKKD